MSFALWSSSYETGHPDVDRQHRRLFAMINELHEAMGRRPGPSGPGSAAEGPGGLHARALHARRKRSCARAGIRHLERHLGLHADLAGQVDEFLLRFSDGYFTLPTTLSRFLAEWLKHHIREEDMAFIAWLKAHQP